MTIPTNTKAQVYIPAKAINTIQERGKQVSDNKEINVVGQDNGRVILELGSGSYQFTTKY